MAKAEIQKARELKTTRVAGLGLTQSLQFKLGMLFLLMLILLAGGAYLASRTLVQEKLLDENFRYEQQSGLRLTAELRALIADAQALAGTLANLAADPELRFEQLRSLGPNLLKNRPSASLITSLGIWAEPSNPNAAAERNSHYWIRDKDGTLRSRTDYNDARSSPYYRERWYTPARFLGLGRGLWTDRRLEPLVNRYVLTYVMPIHQGNNFAGVATVSLDTGAINARFGAIAAQTAGYALLLDGGQRLIGASPAAQARLGSQAPPGTTLASLAKAVPAYAPLAIAAFKRDEARRAAMINSKRFDATQVSALKDGTRGLSRQEADDILSGIWSADLVKTEQAGKTRDALDQDPVLDERAWVSTFDLQDPAWQLLLVTSASDSFSGAGSLFNQSLAVTMALVTLTLLLALLALRMLVIRPLRQMIDQLAGSHSVEDALHVVLDASATNEIGLLAHWQNERIRQLRESMDHARAAKSQLSSESGERKQAQEQLARFKERTALALQSVADAVVITDAQGRIEEMNLAAETLAGMTLRESRNKPLTEVIRLRVNQSEAYQNLALSAIERGARLDFTSGITLESHTGGPREVVLNGSPLRSNGQMVGAVLTFHELSRRDSRESNLAQASINRHQQDLLTGLGTRAVCEGAVTLLIEQAKVSGLTHGLIYLDVDHLKHINDTGGQAAGDDVLVRIAEALTQALNSAKDVYRMAADQFVVVADSVTQVTLLELAEKLRAKLVETRFYWESQYFSVTASFGVVLLSGDLPTAQEAIRRADDACAAAKRAGRNSVQLYDARMDRVGRSVDDETWLRCIKRGLSGNLFHLRTQWIMAGKEYTGEGHAYEVLVALEDDEGFWASPAAFMPVAERHQLTTAIDRWVIENTLSALEQQPAIFETLAFCSINLSTETVADLTFLDFMSSCFEKHPQIAPKLCFELRELALTDQPREAALCCEVLHRMGCRLSVDNYFGRNLSDMALLRKLPMDFIKLDAQGFKNLATDAVEQMMAESVLRIVRHLRRRVIVNNIDDVNMMETWKKLGADYFQGYAFAKPTPVPFLAPY